MFIAFLRFLLIYDIIIVSISYIVINAKILKGKSSRVLIIARLAVTIVIVILELEYAIFKASQGENYCIELIFVCSFSVHAIVYGKELKNNNQQNKK